MKPLFLKILLTGAIKLPPYSKYMKDIFTNKRKVPNEAISTILANYSFSGKIPEKLGDPGIPTIPCSIKNNYVRTSLCDLGAGVSMPLVRAVAIQTVFDPYLLWESEPSPCLPLR